MYQALTQKGWAGWTEFQCHGASIPVGNDGVQLCSELPSKMVVPSQEEQSSVTLGQVHRT